MKAKGIKEQTSKLINCILRAPIKVIRKARDFYLESLIGCTGGGGGGAHRHMSRELSGAEERRLSEEEMTVLLRAAFAELEASMNVIAPKKEESKSKGVDRSYSDRVGRIGRIDENEPCDFMEEVLLLP